MSKTYTLISNASKGGTNNSWTGGDWNNYYLNSNSGEVRECGQRLANGRFCAVYYMFDAATLASLKQKTITSVKLTITVTDGTGIPSGTSDLYAIREKANNSAGSGSSSSAWQGGSAILGWVRRASGSSTTFDVTLSNTIPTYGYTMGAYAAGYGQYLVLASTATLTVTTNEVTVNYKKGANGTGSDVSDVIVPGSALRGATYTRTGYTQTGWSTSDGGPKVYNLSATYSGSSDLTLYPYWTINTYTVKYDANGGTGAPSQQTKTYGQNLTLSTATPSKASASAGSYTVSYNANNGSVSPTSATAARTTSYSFKNWNTAANGSGTSYSSGGTYSTNAAATLYAQWNSSTSTAAITLPTPTRAGYTFNGWYTASSGGTKVGNAGASYTPTGTVTLYAQWTIITYTVTYNVNGGSGTFSNQTKNYGGSFTIHSTKPTKASTSAGSYTVTYNANGGSSVSAASAARTTAYTFSSWNTAQNGGGTSYAAGGTYSANASATLYAQYTSSTTTAAVTLPTTTRSGYTLNGWYTAASGGTKVGNAGASYTPTGNVTLYAQWTASSATLSTVSPSSVDCGNNLTGSWTSTGSTYKYKLKVTCGNAAEAWSSLTAANAQSASVQIPTSWYSMSNGPLRDTASATATCTLYTYASDGTTQIGTASSRTFTVKVPTSVVPSLNTPTVGSSSDNAVVSGWGSTVFVQGYSKVTCAVSVSSYNGSRFSSVRYYGPGLDSTMTSLTASDESSVINQSGTLTYTAVVTDTRGRSASKTVTVTFQPYAQPSVSGIAVMRCDLDGTTNNAGGLYFKATPTYSFSSVTVNGTAKNALVTQTIKYRVHPNGAWSTATPCASGTTYGPWSSSLTSAYDVMVTLADRIQNGASPAQTTTFMTTLPTVQGVWIGKGNDRLGLGGVPEGAGLWCDWDATFNGVVDVTPRRSYAFLPSVGWYRVLTYNATSANDVYGAFGHIIDFNITRSRSSTNNEVHKISLLNPYNAWTFSGEESKSNYLYIDKIRVTVNPSAGSYKTCVDIHYNYSDTNWVAVDFDFHTSHPPRQSLCVASGLTAVADSPSGETVVAEYTFDSNTDMPEFSVTACGKDFVFEKRNGIVYLDSPQDATTASAGWNSVTTLSKGWRPKTYQRIGAGNASPGSRFLSVSPDGAVQLYTAQAISTASNFALSGSWISAK